MRSYLQHAQIGVVLGDTLFVHGAVEERALGFVPSRKTRLESVLGEKGSRSSLRS